MFKRARALVDPVTIYLDGEPLRAERGEPIAQALLAADKTILARSPKLHRPRGASCFRGGCDGCLARVDGAPNVITCQTPARGGEHVSAQNVIGSPSRWMVTGSVSARLRRNTARTLPRNAQDPGRREGRKAGQHEQQGPRVTGC